MATVVSIDWSSPDDIHVLRGTISRPLNDLLVITPDTGEPLLANDTPGKLASAGVTNIQFLITFPNNAHGVTVDTGTPAANGTGSVRALPLAGVATFPRNFIVTAQVTAAATFTAQIRVHLHTSVTTVILSPSTLTARQDLGANPSKVGFSVLAEFDDGVHGNITNYGDPANPTTRLQWQSTSPGLTIDTEGIDHREREHRIGICPGHASGGARRGDRDRPGPFRGRLVGTAHDQPCGWLRLSDPSSQRVQSVGTPRWLSSR